MSDGRTYRFERPDHLGKCLRVPLPSRLRLAASASEQVLEFAALPWAWVALDAGRFAWIDANGVLRTGESCAGPEAGRPGRLVASGGRLWTLSGETLALFDARSLERLARIDLASVADVAGDGKGGVWAVVDDHAVRFDARGRQRESISFEGAAGVDRIVAAGALPMLVSLRDQQLYLYRKGAKARAMGIAGLAAAEGQFVAEAAVSGGGAILLTGHWHDVPGFVTLDGDASPLGFARWGERAPELITLFAGDVWAVFEEARGVVARHFANAAGAAGEVWITPALESDLLSGAWHRAEIDAVLPRPARCAIDFAATADESLVRAAESEAGHSDGSPAERLGKLDRLLPWSGEAVRYTGEQRLPPFVPEKLAAPLSGAQGNFLWLRIAFEHGTAPDPASLTLIVVHHDEPGLMDYLPAVFREPAGDADGTLRRLVDTLEGTFLDFDTRIAALAGRLDPERAEARWLPALARLLDLPFDAVLDETRQRAVLSAGAEILTWRGTRRGVIALLTELFPGRPFRVVDRTAQFAPLALGGGGFAGDRLPGLVSGSSIRTARLNARLVLGRTPLGSIDTRERSGMGRRADLLVAIPADEAEVARLGAAVRQMIEAILPAGVRLTLRWTGWPGAGGGDVLGTVANPPQQMLGGRAPLGGAILGGRGGARLGEGGNPAEFRLV